MPSAKETYRSTLGRGIINPSDSNADMWVHVTGLDGTRGSLDTAITTAVSGRSVHPDDSSLPLRYARAQWLKGADSGSNAEAMVGLVYDKRGSSSAGDATEFSNIANVSVRYITIPWWGKTLAQPPAENGEGTVNDDPDPRAGNAAVTGPQLKYIEVPIWGIYVPAVLSTSPISSVASTAGKVNDAAVTLSGKSFAAKTLRFDAVNQAATKIDDGVSVTYEFDVRYAFSYREDGWYDSYLKPTAGDPSLYAASKQCPYDAVPFPTFPV